MRTGKIIMKDSVEVVVRSKDGKVKKRHTLNKSLTHKILKALHLTTDCLTNTGMAALARRTCGVTETAFTYLAIGIGTTADNAGATGLVNEVKRKAATCTVMTGNGVTNDTAQWVATFSSADTTPTNNASDDINEIGVFNNATTGICLLKIAGSSNYGTADTCNWTDGDTYQLIVKLSMMDEGAEDA